MLEICQKIELMKQTLQQNFKLKTPEGIVPFQRKDLISITLIAIIKVR